MKALVIATALAAFTSIAPAGASRDAQTQAVLDKTTAIVIADAGRIGSTGLTSLNGAPGGWTPQSSPAEIGFEPEAPQIDTGTLLVGAGLLIVALARPIGRLLRRHEQHRRATALASTLGQAPRG